jgi:hypothetical protein
MILPRAAMFSRHSNLATNMRFNDSAPNFSFCVDFFFYI